MAIICNSTTIKTVKVGDTEIFEVRTPSENSLRYNKFNVNLWITYHASGSLYTSSYQTLHFSSIHKAPDVQLIPFYADKDGNITELGRTFSDSFEVAFILPRGSHNQIPSFTVGVGYSYNGIDKEGYNFEDIKWGSSETTVNTNYYW